MKAVLIRHGKVNFRWESWYTAHQFDEACMQYDQAPVMKTCYSIPDSKFSSYYISTLSRTRETAQDIFGVQDSMVFQYWQAERKQVTDREKS